MPSPASLPSAARALATAVVDATSAAGSADLAALDDAARRLAAGDAERARSVLGALVRDLLERRHLDGLTGEDIAGVLSACVAAAEPWFPAIDPGVLVVVLTGALGIEAEDDPLPVPLEQVARHAAVLVHQLLPAGTGVGPALARALAELARAETVEMP